MMRKKNKYNAKRTWACPNCGGLMALEPVGQCCNDYDMIKFPSKGEAKRYVELLLLVRAGMIQDLELQVTFMLDVNGMLICKYIADFVYQEGGKEVVEDSKGVRTPAYRLKAKLMRAVHGITIRET